MTGYLYFFPDYRATNDYQSMLYSSLGKSMAAVGGSLDAAIEFARHNPDLPVAFHLHWPEPLFSDIDDAGKFQIRAESVISKMRLLQAMNGKLFWTIHNKLPHDKRFVNEYIWFHQQMAENADAIFLHSESARDIVSKIYKLSNDRTYIVPHGSYNGIYPNIHSRESARKQLNLGQDEFVIGFIGQLRPYKGLDALVSAFRRLRQSNQNVTLLIAGKPTFPTKVGQWSSMQELVQGLRVEEKFIPIEELSLYFMASDFIALPYVDILTSGSAMLAASFGKPIIIPSLPSLSEFRETGFAIMYDALHPDGLFNSLTKAAELTVTDRSQMESRSSAFGQTMSWRNIAPSFAEVVERHFQLDIKAERPSGLHYEVRWPYDLSYGGVGVCIVDYFSAEETIELVRDLRGGSFDFPVCVYILDNSEDIFVFRKLCRLLPEAVVVRSDSNIGYASGNNLLINLIRSHNRDFVLIVNPDVKFDPDLITALFSFCSIHKDAISSPAILKEDGSVSFAGAFFTEGLDLNVHHFLDGQQPTKLGEEPYKVDALNGCIMFFSMSVYDRLGPLPEQYFLYYEETEWFKRALDAGIDLWIVPTLKATHSKVSHGRAAPSLYYIYYYIRGNSLFASAFNRSVEGAQQLLRNTFVSGWRKRLGEASPSYIAIYDAAVSAALEDGTTLVGGAIDLGSRIDAAANPSKTVAGFIEEIANAGATYIGWVAAPPSHLPDHKPELGVWLFVDDVPVSFVAASISRQDVQTAGYALRSGFELDVPEEFRTGVLRKFEVRSSYTGARLPFASMNHQTRLSTRIMPLVVQEIAPDYEGRIEGVKDAKLAGWLRDKANPSRAVYAKVRIDGKIFNLGFANIFRADLKKAGKGSGKHVFEAILPKSVLGKPGVQIELLNSDDVSVLHAKKVNTVPPTNGFSDKFSFDEFLKWAYVEDRMPIGTYDTSVNLQQQFAFNYCLYSHEAKNITNNTLVSVIMPVFNRASIVRASIESVIKQSYNNWELIIVDDGSVDGSVEEVMAFLQQSGDSRIIFLSHKVNRGVSAARNTGISACKGELICYLDSDNLWKHNTIAILVSALEFSPASVAVYAGQEVWERLDITNETELRFIRAAPFNRTKLEHRNFIDLNVFMHRRKCVEELGPFREDMRRLVDWELILRYTKSFTPLFVPVLLSEYFVNQTNNQITRVENYENAFLGIRQTIEAPGPADNCESPALPSNLTVLVELAEGADVTDWVQLNADWLLDYEADVFTLESSNSGFLMRKILNLEDFVFGRAVLQHEEHSIGALLNVTGDIILTDCYHVAKGGWKTVTTRASLNHGIVIASGQRVPFLRSKITVKDNPLLDSMPAAIASDILEWRISEDLQGQIVSQLPVGWLWLDASLSFDILCALQLGFNVETSLNMLFEYYGSFRRLKCAYLPDILIMEKMRIQ